MKQRSWNPVLQCRWRQEIVAGHVQATLHEVSPVFDQRRNNHFRLHWSSGNRQGYYSRIYLTGHCGRKQDLNWCDTSMQLPMHVQGYKPPATCVASTPIHPRNEVTWSYLYICYATYYRSLAWSSILFENRRLEYRTGINRGLQEYGTEIKGLRCYNLNIYHIISSYLMFQEQIQL